MDLIFVICLFLLVSWNLFWMIESALPNLLSLLVVWTGFPPIFSVFSRQTAVNQKHGYPLASIATKEPLISGMHLFQRMTVATPTTIPKTAISSLHLNPKMANKKGAAITGLLMSKYRNIRRSRASPNFPAYNASKIASIPMTKQVTLAKYSCCLPVSLFLQSGLTISWANRDDVTV